MKLALALVVAVYAGSPAVGLRKGGNSSAQQVAVFECDTDSEDPCECQSLENITIGDHKLGQAAVMLCSFWPSAFGEFPLKNTHKIADILKVVFDEGGLYDQILELIKNRGNQSDFCWRAISMREVQDAEEGGALQLKGNDAQGCRPAADNCEMVQDGVCYGDCPSGFTPSPLASYFRPVCHSVCADTHHTYACGFGCANGYFGCIWTVVDQVGEVARVVGALASWLSGNPLIHETVDQILRVVELAVGFLFDLIKLAKQAWASWTKEEGMGALLMLLLQVIIKNAKDIGDDFGKVRKSYGEAVELIYELMDMEFEWEEWEEINLVFITDSILKHGATVLKGAFNLTKAFYYPRCKMADDSVAFAIEEAGDLRVTGPWSQSGVSGGHPQYTLQRDGNVTMARSNGGWLMSVNGEAVYKTSLPLSDYPDHGWHSTTPGVAAPHVFPVKKKAGHLQTNSELLRAL